MPEYEQNLQQDDDDGPDQSGLDDSRAVGAGAPSVLNILLLYLALLGLGAIGGYTAFYLLFSERCTALMNDVTTKHGEYRTTMQSKYEQALEGQRQCMTDTSLKDELSSLQGRLEAQSTLTNRHQNLLQQQEDTLTRLGTLQAAHEVASQTVMTLKEELSQTRQLLQQAKKDLQESLTERNKMKQGYEDRVALTGSLLQKRVEEVEALSQQQQHCDVALPQLRQETMHMKNYIRQRNHQACKMEYGNGPFQVEFRLEFPATMGPEEEPNKFLVELASLAEMPHTIFTFLDLIDLQLFDDTAFVSANALQIEGGAPIHAPTEHTVKLYERYAKFGYGRTPLAFNEQSDQFPVQKFALGFAGAPIGGPGLVIHMSDHRDDTDTDGLNKAVFGKVVRGFDTLARVQAAPKSADGYRLAKNIRIVSVRLVRNNRMQ